MRTRTQRKWTQLSSLTRLEDRITPVVYLNYGAVDGYLTVTSDAADAIEIDSFNSGINNGALKVNGVTVLDAGGQPVRADAVTKLVINGGPGANVINLAPMRVGHFPRLDDFGPRVRIVPSDPDFDLIQIHGGGGDDTITGSPLADYIDGGAGIDTMSGGRGNDFYIIDPGEQCDDGNTSTNDGCSISLNGLPPGTPLLTGTINLDTNTNSFSYGALTWTMIGIEKTFFDAGNFASALGQCSVSLTPQSSNPGAYARIILEDSLISGYSISGQGSGDPVPTESISFNFAKIGVDYKLQGTGGDDSFDINPGRNKITVDGGAGNDSVFVNHGGYSFTQPVGAVQVAGRAPVLHSNVETVEIGRKFSGDAAIADLAAKGVAVTLTTGDVNQDGMVDIIVATIKNDSALPVTAVNVEIIDAYAEPQDCEACQETYRVQYRESDFDFATLRVVGNGLTPTVDPHLQGTPLADLVAGEYPYASEISFAAASITASATASATAWFAPANNDRSWIDTRYVIDCKLQLGGTRYAFSVWAPSTDSEGEAITYDVALAPTGKTSTFGASTLSGVSSNGAAALMVSAANDLDSFVTSVFPGTHVYVNNVTVDTGLAPNATGNGQSYGASMDAAARYVAFTTDATQLVLGVQDVNPFSDVYVRDMLLGTTKLVSGYVPFPGLMFTGNGKSNSPQVSADGHFVYFLSEAPNLISGVNDTNNEPDLFRYDTSTGLLKCMSVTPAGTSTGNKGVDLTSPTGLYSIGAEGTSAAWLTLATDLVPGGSPPGMHMAFIPRIGQEVVVSFNLPAANGAGVRVSGDGDHAFFWTNANLQALTGVPDTNNMMDLFSYDAKSSTFRAVSANDAKTGMGNGASPGSPIDAPAVTFDGSLIAFTSNATDLLPGAPLPSNSGLYRAELVPSVWLLTRIDKLPGGGYGGDNHEPAISPDGRFVGFTSKTNYAGGPAYANSQTQLWDHCFELPHTLLSADVAGQPGTGASQGVRFADNGGLVLFQSDAKLLANDVNNFTDVYSSVAHLSLSYTTPTGNGTDEVTVKVSPPGGAQTYASFDTYLKIGGVATLVASRPLGATRHVFINGAAGEDDTLTVDFGSGMAGVSSLFFNGGTGAGTDQASIVGGETDYANIALEADVLIDNGTTRFRLMEEEGIYYYATANGHWVNFNPGSLFNLAISDNGIANDGIYRVTGFAPYTIDLNGAGAASINFVLSSGNDTVNLTGFDGLIANTVPLTVNGLEGSDTINASAMPRPVTLIGGPGNDTLTGTAGDDCIYIDSGTDTLNGGLGDDVYFCEGDPDQPIVVGSVYMITDPSGRDTLDFSAANFGVTIDYRSNAEQIIDGLNGKVQLNGQFERFIGSGFNDHVIVPFTLNSFFDVFGELQIPSGADTFTFDAQGKPASTSFTSIYAGNNQLAANFDGFEQVNLINVAPPPCIAVNGVTINGGDVQRSRVTTVKIDFDQVVTLPPNPADAFQLKRNGDNAIVGLSASVVHDSATHVTLTFTGAVSDYLSLQDGRYTLTVIASKAYTLSGQLDGDCNGSGGDNYVLASAAVGNPPTNIFRIFGDITGDGAVAANDFIQFRQYFNGVNAAFDFDNDGAVAASDFIQFRQRFNGSI